MSSNWSLTRLTLVLLFLTAIPLELTRGSLINFTDLGSFQAAVGTSFAINFTDLSDGTPLSTQYSIAGVLFTDGNDTVLEDPAFLTDQHGVWGHGSVSLEFPSPISALGAEFAGGLQIDLFSGSLLVGTSQQFAGLGDGLFGGIISSEPFDRAIVSDWYDGKAFIDNLYSRHDTVPTPIPDAGGALALLVLSSSVLWLFAKLCRSAGGT